MSQPLILSVVDQSPMREGSGPGEALRETIELAVAVEATPSRPIRSRIRAGPGAELPSEGLNLILPT